MTIKQYNSFSATLWRTSYIFRWEMIIFADCLSRKIRRKRDLFGLFTMGGTKFKINISSWATREVGFIIKQIRLVNVHDSTRRCWILSNEVPMLCSDAKSWINQKQTKNLQCKIFFCFKKWPKRSEMKKISAINYPL